MTPVTFIRYPPGPLYCRRCFAVLGSASWQAKTGHWVRHYLADVETARAPRKRR